MATAVGKFLCPQTVSFGNLWWPDIFGDIFGCTAYAGWSTSACFLYPVESVGLRGRVLRRIWDLHWWTLMFLMSSSVRSPESSWRTPSSLQVSAGHRSKWVSPDKSRCKYLSLIQFVIPVQCCQIPVFPAQLGCFEFIIIFFWGGGGGGGIAGLLFLASFIIYQGYQNCMDSNVSIICSVIHNKM